MKMEFVVEMDLKWNENVTDSPKLPKNDLLRIGQKVNLLSLSYFANF